MIKKSAVNKECMLLDNMHLSLRQKDKTSITHDPSGWGFVLSGTKGIDGKFFPFARFAYTKDEGSLLQKTFATGHGYPPNPKGSLLCFGKVNETTIAEGLDNQYVIEAFYHSYPSPGS